MEEFGVPGIGVSRWNQLREAKINDLQDFRRASRDKIESIGNAHILKAWVMDQQRIGKAHPGSALDAAKARCEIDLAEQTRRAIGELNQPIELLPQEAVPASCTQEVRTLLIHDQQYLPWREYVATEVEHARQITREQQLLRAPKQSVGVGSAQPGTTPPNFYLVSTDNHMFFANRDNFDKLFPSRKNDKFLATSDQVGALLQALSNDRPVPKPELLASIADQLLAMAQKYNMPFLRFLAQDYDLYPVKNFQLSQIIALKPGATPNQPAITYFIQNNIEPVAANLATYVNGLASDGKEVSAEIAASLWIQALRIPDPTKRGEALAALGSLNTQNDWFLTFADRLKTDALRRRSQDTFELLFAASQESFKTVKDDKGTPKQVDAEWAKIILDEHVPFAKVTQLGFTFGDNVMPYLEPVYEKTRRSLDSPSSVEAFKLAFSADAVRKHILRTGKLNTEEDQLWALDLLLLERSLLPLMTPLQGSTLALATQLGLAP
jgi:hypothetical protein